MLFILNLKQILWLWQDNQKSSKDTKMLRFSFLLGFGIASSFSIATAHTLACYRVSSASECIDRKECYWNPLTDHCMNTFHGPNSHYCSTIEDQEECTYTLGCHWKPAVGRCLGSA